MTPAHLSHKVHSLGPKNLHYITVCIDAYRLHEAPSAEQLIDLELAEVKRKLMALLSPK